MVEFGPYRLDPAEERLWKGDKPITIRRKPFAILRYLTANPRRLVTHAELLEHVWAGQVVSESAVRTHLHELRQVLGEGVIETVIGRGYRFAAPLTNLAQAPTAPPAIASTPTLVGRDDELRQLRTALERARSGHRELCFVTGDAGFGKTALVDAFLDEIERGGEAACARGQCIEQHGSPEAYLAVIEVLDTLRHGKLGEQVTTALVRYAPTFLAQVPRLCSDAQLVDVTRRAAGSSESRLVRELIEALEALASQTTIVIVLEDLQWSDVATVDLLSVLCQRRDRAKLMVIATARRAESQTAAHPLHRVMRSLIARGSVTAIPLERIASADIARLVQMRFGGELGQGFIDAIDRTTAGTPLFVKLLLDDLVVRGMLVEQAGAWQLAVSIAELAAHRPESLRQLIDIQVDRLTPDEQRVLEAASVAGAEFATVVVAAALEKSEEHVDEICDQLARRSLFLRRAPSDQLADGTLVIRYAVNHALVQEVCVERCAPARRQRWHRLIAERLETLYGAADDHSHVLAMHYDRGSVLPRAIHFYIIAAERTARRFAASDTLVLFQRAHALVLRTPHDRERDATELRVLQGLSSTILRTSGPSDMDPLALFERMVELARKLGDHRVLAVALANASIRHSTLADYHRGAEIAEQIELDPDSPRSLCELVDTARVLPMIWRGQLAPALSLLDRLSTGEHVEEQQLGILGSPDRRALLAAYASFVRWIVGEYDGALADAHRAIELAEANGDPFALGLTYCNLARLRVLAGDATDVQADAERVLAMPHAGIWHSQANILIAWVAAFEGRFDDAAATELVNAYRERVKRLPLGRSHLVHPVIDALRITQRTAAALALADEVLAHIRQAGERALESELVRVRGELVEANDRGAAEAAYREALAIARELGAHGLEARAAARLDKLAAPRS